MTLRSATLVVLLTGAWCGLWGSLSPANITGGLALAILIMVQGIGTSGQGGISIGPLLRLIRLVLVDLARSTVSVASEILTPTDYTAEGIIAVDVPEGGGDHILVLVVAITVTPGTAVVEVDRENGTLYLHLLHVNRRAATEAHVKELAQLAGEALPNRSRTRSPSQPEASS